MNDLKTIKEELVKYTEELNQKEKEYNEKTWLYSSLEEEIKQLYNEVNSYKRIVDKYSKIVANENYDNIVGKYFIRNSYREDTKCGTIQIGKITEFSTQTYLKYIGVDISYINADYNKDIDNVYIRSIRYSLKNGQYDSIYLSGFENGTFKLITEGEYIENCTKIKNIIDNNNELIFI